jgi:hypothetical protein
MSEEAIVSASRHGHSTSFLVALFAFTSLATGFLLYGTAERLKPAIESIGIGGIWVDLVLLFGGLTWLWFTVPPDHPRTNPSDPQLSPSEAPPSA